MPHRQIITALLPDFLEGFSGYGEEDKRSKKEAG
jgi:hypothetical protein